MSPKEYIKARENGVKCSIIDGHPYLPFMNIDTKSDEKSKVETAKQIVIEIFFGGNGSNGSSYNGHTHTNGGTTINGSNGDKSDAKGVLLNVEQIQGGITNELYHLSGLHKLMQVNPVENGGNTNELLIVSGIPNGNGGNGNGGSGNGDTNGNNSNTTATSANDIPNSVLIRIFGGEGMIDRDVENSTFAAISKAGIAPKYYGRFGNGRIEEYYENIHTLQVEEMGNNKDVSKSIAIALATFHSTFTMPKYLQEYHNVNGPPSMWNQLYSWYEQASADNIVYKSNSDQERALALNVTQYYDELKWLQNAVVPKNSQIGFCHNDLLAANILLDKSKSNNDPKIHLIDFEYGGMNYFSFDIANHFNEYAGGTSIAEKSTPNYSLFPSYHQQYTFIRHYLQAYNNNGKEPTDDEIQSRLKEVESFLLVNHLYWGLWAVNQAATEGSPNDDPTKFNYLQYAKCRFTQYWYMKNNKGSIEEQLPN